MLNKFRGTKVSMGFKIPRMVYGCLLSKEVVGWGNLSLD